MCLSVEKRLDQVSKKRLNWIKMIGVQDINLYGNMQAH